MNTPDISILIPVFNRQEFIADCIESAIQQTYHNFEIIVVDNASTDGTWEICRKFALLNNRVKIFRNDKNIGPVGNWIRCAEEAKGKFSKILFSDDSLEPNCLQEMLPWILNRDVGFVYTAVRIGHSYNTALVAYGSDSTLKISSKDFINQVLMGRAPVSPGAILIRTSDLRNNLHIQFPTATYRNFEKNGAGSDVMIMLLTAYKYPYVSRISKPLVFFRMHNESITIENKNNEVINGYTSAISFFLKSIRHDEKNWIKYLAYDWSRRIKHERKWISPVKHINEFEGNNSGKDLLIFLLYLASILGKKCFFSAMKSGFRYYQRCFKHPNLKL